MTSGRPRNAIDLLERRRTLLMAPVLTVEQVPAVLADIGLRVDWPKRFTKGATGFLYFGRLRGSGKLGFTSRVTERTAELKLSVKLLVSGAHRGHETALVRALHEEALDGSREYVDGPLFTALLAAGAVRATVRFGETTESSWLWNAVRGMGAAPLVKAKAQGAA